MSNQPKKVAKQTELSQRRLLDLFDYDPKVGIFYWKKDGVCGRGRVVARAGKEAGTTCKRSGYRLINIDCVPRPSHRLAWLYVYGNLPVNRIDHINGNPSDNRIANLRDVVAQVNSQNMRRAMASKKHGSLLGTAWHKGTGKWRALIKVGFKQRSLGYFNTEEEAHEAYLVGKRKFHEGCTI